MWKNRILRILVLAVPAIAIAAAVTYWLGPPAGRDVSQAFASVGGPIALVDQAGRPVTEKSFAGKWRVVFFWPKDFTFVCPTEIAGFGKLNQDFLDRDCQILGGSTDSEFVHPSRF